MAMANSRRGGFLTTMAVLFVLLAIEDILKPLHLEGPTTGLVFFGRRLSGVHDAVLGPLVGIFLLIYAAGIWRMRRYALYLGFAYAIYVTINLVLFTATNPMPTSRGDQVFGIVYSILALVLTWATAIFLSRHKGELT
jgi:hypothetical protein